MSDNKCSVEESQTTDNVPADHFDKPIAEDKTIVVQVLETTSTAVTQTYLLPNGELLTQPTSAISHATAHTTKKQFFLHKQIATVQQNVFSLTGKTKSAFTNTPTIKLLPLKKHTPNQSAST